jgi:hypothetical protein
LGVAPERRIADFLNKIKQFLTNTVEDNLKEIFNILEELELGGIDLSVFVKQVLVYVDKHFLEDVVFYSKVADLFKRILLNLKFYPNSLLAYKVEIAKEVADR